ncbi:MAG: TetR/AcrR family transcriptional regulator [Gordonia amarae]
MTTVGRTRRSVGRPAKSPEEEQEQRERLLRATVDVIREEGPEASIEAIARRAGCAKPLVYELFGSKSGLAMAVSVRFTGQRLLAHLATGDGSLRSQIRSLVQAYVDIVEQDEAIYRFVVFSGRQGGTSLVNQPLLQLVQPVVSETVDIPKARAEVAASGILGMAFAAIEAWSYSKQIANAELVDTVTAMIFGAIEELNG